MRAIVRHSLRSIAKPATRRVATVALVVLATTVPVSAAMASEQPAPGRDTAATATESAPGRTIAATATTAVEETREVVREVVELLTPFDHTWGN
ncbi:hypothetical protein H9Y04_00035 [Streptomyces sp. TRM66268-LWL]|uniref:Uncharacterized protein n=1 Tax=Streptomyces polyasparticus TaxID=2767826 RepID=A0ABR7S862_9ACTN|nr:hypothetical protein [Streptomyces polyasparticus]MBC9710965.1 hypothetical protein [Streptomyces polyasparticus]